MTKLKQLANADFEELVIDIIKLYLESKGGNVSFEQVAAHLEALRSELLEQLPKDIERRISAIEAKPDPDLRPIYKDLNGLKAQFKRVDKLPLDENQFLLLLNKHKVLPVRDGLITREDLRQFCIEEGILPIRPAGMSKADVQALIESSHMSEQDIKKIVRKTVLDILAKGDD